MRFDVLTLFPELFASYLGQSLLAKAIERRLVEVHLHNIRDWAGNKHHKLDDRPFGGGPGMVLRVEPVVECVEEIRRQHAADPGRLILLTPQGRRLDQALVEELAGATPVGNNTTGATTADNGAACGKRLILLCGRYEGFDQRVADILRPDEISIGDYVLNGGEVAAMVIIDAVIRYVPGVLGHEESHRQDSFSGEDRLLESAQYTRPREYRGHAVPEILVSGHHGQIAAWRASESRERTDERRPPDEPANHDSNPSP